jgi:hypothetical protein
MVARDRLDESIEDLLHHDHYSPEELSRLLDLPIHIIRHAAFTGELKAYIVGHHIVSLRRDDIVRWLRERG